MQHKAILCVDFDDTIFHTKFPTIISLRKDAKYYINKLYDEGFYIKIYTCRNGEHVNKAKLALDQEGIKYHLINENHPKLISFFGSDTRKLSGDFYIDDKCLTTYVNPVEHEWCNIYQNIHKAVNQPNFKSLLSFCNDSINQRPNRLRKRHFLSIISKTFTKMLG